MTTPPASSQSLVQLPGREGRSGQPLETSHPVMEGRCPLFSFPHRQENWAWLVLLLTPACVYGTEAAVLLCCHVLSAQRQGLLLWSTTLTSVLPHSRLSAPLSKVLSPSASHLDPTATTGAIESMAHGMPVVLCPWEPGTGANPLPWTKPASSFRALQPRDAQHPALLPRSSGGGCLPAVQTQWAGLGASQGRSAWTQFSSRMSGDWNSWPRRYASRPSPE